MRNIPENINAHLREGAHFVYCFKFSNTEKTIFLTSNNRPITLEDGVYKPHCGLEVKKALLNDSAQNYLEITGVFEDEGIKIDDDLSGYTSEVSLYFPEYQATYPILTYFCSRVLRDGLKFTLYLEPITGKLNQSLLGCFGSTCRANLGDHSCRVDLGHYPEGTYCDKSFRTCCNKFNNGVNFRGEPFIPCAP